MKNSPSRGMPLTQLVSTPLPSPFYTSIDSTKQTGYKKLPLLKWPRKFNLPSPAGAKEVQPEMETLPVNNWNEMGCLREVPTWELTMVLTQNWSPKFRPVSLKTSSCRLCRPSSEWVNCRCSQWALPALILGLKTANSSSSQGTATCLRCSPLHLEHRLLHSQLFLLRTILMKMAFNADLYRQMALPAWVGWNGICSCNYTNITKYVALCGVLFIMWC